MEKEESETDRSAQNVKQGSIDISGQAKEIYRDAQIERGRNLA